MTARDHDERPTGRNRARRQVGRVALGRVGFAAAISCALLVVACNTGSTAATALPQESRAPVSRLLAPDASPKDEITIMYSRYGAIQLRTAPSSSCTLQVQVDSGTFGDGPPLVLHALTGRDGLVAWSYPTPLIPPGAGRHVVSC